MYNIIANCVKSAHFVLLAVSEKAKTRVPFFSSPYIIKHNIIDLSIRPWGMNLTNSVIDSPEPHTEVYCFRRNFNISNWSIIRIISNTSLFFKADFVWHTVITVLS